MELKHIPVAYVNPAQIVCKKLSFNFYFEQRNIQLSLLSVSFHIS